MCVTFTLDLSLDTNFCIYEHTFTGDSYSLTKMPAADLARIKNFKLHWTSISNGARASTHRRVESSAETSQVDNVKKMTTTFGKRAEPESKELKDAIHLVISEIDFRDIT